MGVESARKVAHMPTIWIILSTPANFSIIVNKSSQFTDNYMCSIRNKLLAEP
jgi:hypothetical protein